jgi:apolipoprotein N-acyltransferase
MWGLSLFAGRHDCNAGGAPRSTKSQPRIAGQPWGWEDFYPGVAGLLMALSFPPINLSFLAFVALVPLFIYLDKPTFARTVRAGLLCSTVFFGVVLSWITAVGTFSWLAFPGYAALILLHDANFFFFVVTVTVLKSYLALPFVCTAPFAWVVCESLRSYGDLSFPWTAFGYALTPFPWSLQFADIVGIYGVSFWLVLLNALLWEAIRSRGVPARWRWYAMVWLIAFGSASVYNAVHWLRQAAPDAARLNVAVVQPNIAQRIKWDERYSREILKKIFAMNATATRETSDLVVWPETAIPYYLDENRPFHLTEMGKLPPGQAPVLTGVLYSSRDNEGRSHYYNGAALFDSRGSLLRHYKKIYLVPGSEKYPFRRLLGFTRPLFNVQDINYGLMESGERATVFTLESGRFSVLICYESAFPQLARAFRLAGAQFLVNITNDAWFGRSFAAYQHASFLVMRAIESRTAIVRCGNTGISGFIDPLGRWQQKTELSTESILWGTVPMMPNLTFYTRFGDIVVYLSYGALGLFLLMALRKKFSTIEESAGK